MLNTNLNKEREMIYRGYDIEETPFGISIYFNKEYISTSESIEEAQDLIDEELLTIKLKKERA
jgi:hypothetical protein|tara:strand:- start:220 stop:408 length:189 start_codon:yes stop_codon:yes gene_type:complete